MGEGKKGKRGNEGRGKGAGAALRLLLAHGVDSLIYETFHVPCSSSRLNTLRVMLYITMRFAFA